MDEINQKLSEYSANWEKLVAARTNKEFFEGLKPVALGWKVADEADYKQLYERLREDCDRIVETWMNDRWIAKMHLKDAKLTGNIEIIKLMQRRPGSDDKLGLDHVDFYSPEVVHADEILSKEQDLKWTHESNDVVDNYDWISIWFNNTEAKLKAATVIDIVTKELQEINKKLKSV